MTQDHWLDQLQRTLAGDAARRGLLRSAAAMASALVLGPSAMAKNRKHKGKGNKGGKGGKGGNGKGGSGNNGQPASPPPPLPPSPPRAPRACSEGLCQSHWPGSDDIASHNRNYCEFICEQCDGTDPREFCITGGGGPCGI